MDEEERKLTILLAKLNADLQIQLAESLGLAALALASFVAGYQFLATTQSPSNIELAIFLMLFGIASIVGAVIVQRRLKRTMDKLRDLK